MGGNTFSTTRAARRDVKISGVRCFRVLHSADAGRLGRVLPLVEPEIRLGRSPMTPPHLHFDDEEMSRQHARVTRDADGGHTVVDFGSTNGTHVNGRRVRKSALRPGDIVRIGTSLFLYDEIWRHMDDAGTSPLSQLLVGSSAAMQEVIRQIELSARGDLTVLILGESGSGKELVARGVHERSERRGPFLAANCGSLVGTLVESELFGHVRGAFTGATSAAPGLFRSADRGTLFLDEIGDLPIDQQTRLLRVLETGEVRPVGSAATTKVDVRVVAATNTDLERAVDDGRFRGDLFARLDHMRITLPSLRERRDDILPLFDHFLRKHGAGEHTPRLDADAAEALLVNPWRYNVRELEKVARLVLLERFGERASAEPLTVDALPAPYRVEESTREEAAAGYHLADDPEAFQARVRESSPPDKDDLEEILTYFRGRIVDVADFLGKERRQIYRWLDRYGLDIDEFRVVSAASSDRSGT